MVLKFQRKKNYQFFLNKYTYFIIKTFQIRRMEAKERNIKSEEHYVMRT